ncbi:MAG: stage II sporulation protein M [Bacteroidota bacterium]
MRETQFISKNKDKWGQYEKALERERQDPDLLSELYIHATDDLSYSRTFYPNRSVRVYLNGLARRTFLKVYKGRRGESSRFFSFWTDELPRILYKNRRALTISLVVFTVSMLIGVVSYLIDPEFAELILSEGYMETTRANIDRGDPMAIYKDRDAFGMFLYITLNNIRVALLTFALGVFAGVGSLVLLIQNGVMLGVFQYYFLDQGLFWESFSTIWIHGAIEISSIIIAGAAGLVMGGGWLFPGTLSRAQSFARSAREGVKIILGTIPLFIIAGFLESYLTRHTELPIAIRLLFILLCFAFIIWYYYIYPRLVVRSRPQSRRYDDRRLAAGSTQPIQTNRIKMMGEIYSDTFSWLWKQGKRAIIGCLLIATLYCFFAFNFTGAQPAYRFQFESNSFLLFYNFVALLSSWGMDREPGFILLVFGSLFAIQYVVYRLMNRELKLHDGDEQWWQPLKRLILPSAFLTILVAFSAGWTALLCFLFLPFVLTYGFVSYFQLGGIGKTVRYVYGHLVSAYSLSLLLLLLGFIIALFFDSTVSQIIFNFLGWIIAPDISAIDDYNNIILAFLNWTYLGFILILLSAGLGLNFLSVKEQEEAFFLLEEIENIGQEKRLRGLAVE